jgi:DNA topoisomerase VI subunit B
MNYFLQAGENGLVTVAPLAPDEGNVKNGVPASTASKLAGPQSSGANFQVHRPDTALFSSLQGLTMQSGVPAYLLRRLVLKELADNALDAADAVGRSGQVRIEQTTGNVYVIEDQGAGMDGSPNEIATMFSLGRVMISTKFWRLPSRGCLGNGLRIIVGTVAATGGTIEITTRNCRLVLRPLKSGRTEIVSTEPADHPVGTRLAVTFGDELPRDQAAMSWAKSAIALAQTAGSGYSRAANPHWFDIDQFTETLSLIEPPETTLRQFVERLDGCAGAKGGQMVAKFGKGRTCRSMTEAEARELLIALQAGARVVKPDALGPIGETAFNPELYGYSKREGIFAFGTHEPRATIPFLVEVWVSVSDRKGDDASISCQCNRTPIVGEIEAFRRRSGSKSISISGVGLDLTHDDSIDLPKGDCDIHLHITSPLIPTSSIGKRPHLRDFSTQIAAAIRQAFIRSRNRLPPDPAEPKEEKVKPLKPPSHVSIVLNHLDEGIALTSENGKYIFGQRNLFYKIRTFVEKETGGEVLMYPNFTQIITDYESKHGDIRGMIRDDRGSFFDLAAETPLGTAAVANYSRVPWRYHKVIYCEKEDQTKILRQSGWVFRHDCAVMSSKGFSSRAARDIVDKIADTGGDEPVRLDAASPENMFSYGAAS